MLDIRFIRENPELIQAAARKKRLDFDLPGLIAADDERLALLSEIEKMRARQNEASRLMTPGSEPATRSRLIAEMSQLKTELRGREGKLAGVVKEWRRLMLQVPNVPDMSVPEGADEKDNQEIRRWGEAPVFTFPAKSHLELLQARGWFDPERGAKVAGFRGYVLAGAAVSLSFAIWQLALNSLIKKKFTPLLAPSLVKKEILLGTGYLPHGEEDLYQTQDGMYLAGTGEVGTMGYFMDEVLEVTELPKKIVAFSPCFRREAGAHGKDTKGLIRVHEFFKVEQLVLSEANHETSVRWHEELTANAEELLQALGLPYRVVALCGGDLGRPHVKTYDIEVWFPSEGRYRETHSSSYYHDFQTRRLNIRYRDPATKRLLFTHSLNSTAFPTPRLLAALVENCQRADGRLSLPPVLQAYCPPEIWSEVHAEETGP